MIVDIFSSFLRQKTFRIQLVIFGALNFLILLLTSVGNTWRDRVKRFFGSGRRSISMVTFKPSFDWLQVNTTWTRRKKPQMVFSADAPIWMSQSNMLRGKLEDVFHFSFSLALKMFSCEALDRALLRFIYITTYLAPSLFPTNLFSQIFAFSIRSYSKTHKSFEKSPSM